MRASHDEVCFFFKRQKFAEFKEKLGRSLRGLIISAEHPQVGIKSRFGRLNHRAAILNQLSGRCRLYANMKCGME